MPRLITGPDTRRAGAGGRARVRRALSLLAQVGPLRRAGQVKTRARARATAQVGGRATTTAAIWSAQTLPTVARPSVHAIIITGIKTASRGAISIALERGDEEGEEQTGIKTIHSDSNLFIRLLLEGSLSV